MKKIMLFLILGIISTNVFAEAPVDCKITGYFGDTQVLKFDKVSMPVLVNGGYGVSRLYVSAGRLTILADEIEQFYGAWIKYNLTVLDGDLKILKRISRKESEDKVSLKVRLASPSGPKDLICNL